ncbi:MAG: branched-chain amino acid ABC transporter permease [Candidatus Rokubacteria bacterium]|nr:branched-chain amino acid ABC transporter permease [Candidatus Rokubacteria bacterium]MBI2554627.1 branched-chain amino acid ABC transporter permease [Candidatus Rokubacteria bacterium]
MFAAVLFLISVGLTLVFGVLRILNVSHGGIYAFGAYMATYLAIKILGAGASPYLTYLMLLAGAIIIGMVTGPIIERVFLRRIYGSDQHITLLLTFSIFLILDDLLKLIWGTKPMFVSQPYTLLGEFSIAGIPYSWYQVVLIVVSIVFGGALVWAVRGTRFGKIVVSVINDREISQAIGINVNRIYTVSFTLGAFCAALGGALIAPTISVTPGFALDATVLAFAVIAIGGMGSLEGAALGALIVGLLRALAVHLLPEADLVVIYLAMILVLVVRPEGLFGQVELRRI